MAELTRDQQRALALASARLRLGQGTRGNTFSGVAGQFGAGSQTGIARAAGFPVDAVAGAISGVGDLTGLWGPIENPVGGSESIGAMLEPFRRGIPEPQTMLERGARRVGEEVGASAAMLPAAFASPAVRAAPVASTAVEASSALGSGLGAAVANEVAPGSVVADVAGALGGGLPIGMLASRMLGLNNTAARVRPGIEDQKMRAADSYGLVRADNRMLPQNSIDDLAQGVNNRMASERINPRLHPGASAVRDAILDDTAVPMRIEDVEDLRRLTTQAMPKMASDADNRLAQIMKSEITDYLDNLGDPVADELRTGRDAHRRASAATLVDDITTRASRRAARTGSGGNEINATRQNIAQLIENPRLSRSFTPSELDAMDSIVRGTSGQNLARRLSRFAPSSGGLSSMLGMGGVAAVPHIAAPAIIAAEAGKALGEASTKKSIRALLQSLAPDKVLAPGTRGVEDIIRALLAARTASNAQ